MPQPPQHIPPSSTLSMDLPFSLRELDHALGSMHPRKAPGDDGITTALMQAIAHDPKDHGTGDVKPGSPRGRPLYASNLRGISLINVGLKILCKMVQARLSSLLESNNVLVPEQGGFRTREESTAQVCALMDILRRRQIADLNSHIAFIDISKAFDTVPIHALLFKLRCIGIPTITMNFLSALYSTSNARIRSGSLLSDPFPVQRDLYSYTQQHPPKPSSPNPIQLHGIDLPSVSQYEYLGVIIDDLLNLSPLASQEEARYYSRCALDFTPLLRNNFLSTRYRLTIFNGLVLGVAYYGLKLIRGNSTLARRLQAPVNTGIRMILKAPLFTPIAPMLTDCGIISLDAHAILGPHINPSIQTPHSLTPVSQLHSLLSPLPPTISEIRHQRSKYAFERTFQVWGKSKLACSYVQANRASSVKFLRSPALSTGQAIGASLLSLARCGGLWDYPRALKAGLLHPTATNPDQLGSPSLCILCHAHLDCKPMAHLVVQDTVEENPTASRTTTTDTHTAAISSTPTPTQISYIGSDDILTVLLGGSLPGTNTAGNTEACPGQQWLTGTVEEGNLLSSNPTCGSQDV
ncbi:hypothetical protein BASA83_013150 [Batrachochytrium salamandrivorans]|nr:hypothetical protein BASA83_013150 [Batrachochytrium salamandrivorans]